jgi:hypothetical protein
MDKEYDLTIVDYRHSIIRPDAIIAKRQFDPNDLTWWERALYTVLDQLSRLPFITFNRISIPLPENDRLTELKLVAQTDTDTG